MGLHGHVARNKDVQDRTGHGVPTITPGTLCAKSHDTVARLRARVAQVT